MRKEIEELWLSDSTVAGVLRAMLLGIAVLWMARRGISQKREHFTCWGCRLTPGRTDLDGAVHIVTDGDRLEISCSVACLEASTG